MKTPLIFILAATLAWWFGPILTGVVTIIPWAAIGEIVMPSKLSERSPEFYVALVFWTTVLFYALPFIGSFLFGSFAATERRSNTKLVRRIQGLMLDLVIAVFLLLCAELMLFALWGAGTDLGPIPGAMRHLPKLLLVLTPISFWYISVPLTVVLYLTFHRAVKADLAHSYTWLIGFIEAGRFGKGGSSRFAGLIEEWPFRREEGSQGLFLGRSLFSRTLHLSLKDDRHMLTIAGSRSGKGVTAIIPNLLLWEGSALVIDPKGTNAAVTANHHRLMGRKVNIVDPFNVLKQGTATINPLAMLDPNAADIREQISVIAEALVVPDPGTREKHWDDGARSILVGMITHLITRYPNPSLPMLRQLLAASDDEQIELWADMSLNEDGGGAAKEAANRLIRGIGTNEILSLLSNADKHTEWLSSPAMKALLGGGSSFTFANLKEQPTLIYLVLPPEYLETHNRFLRLFVNLAIKQMSVGGRSKIPVLMILDEFLALGHMSEVAKAFGLMAGYNFVLWPFIQDLGRLRDIYKNSVNSFINNSRAVQIFGVTDPETTKFVSEQIGDHKLENLIGIKDGKGTVALRTPSEVAKEVSIDSGLQYILRAGKAPMVLERVRYYEDSVSKSPFADMSDAKPDKLVGRMRRRLYPFADLYLQDPDYRT